MGPLAVNQLYWQDTLKTCEAYTVMCSWRMVDMARSCVWALERDDALCAAILARSALEGTAQFADAARTISATLDGLSDVDREANIVVSTDLEAFLLKTVFASRLPIDDPIYHPTNIVTIVQRISKIEGQSLVLATYQDLCEITHPNFLGRSVYVADTRANTRPGDEIRTLSFEKGPMTSRVVLTAVRALSWACATHVPSALLLQKSISNLWTKMTD
jgi:hypothetical protein